MFAEILAKQLMQRGKADISDHDLHKLIYSMALKTDLVKILHFYMRRPNNKLLGAARTQKLVET